VEDASVSTITTPPILTPRRRHSTKRQSSSPLSVLESTEYPEPVASAKRQRFSFDGSLMNSTEILKPAASLGRSTHSLNIDGSSRTTKKGSSVIARLPRISTDLSHRVNGTETPSPTPTISGAKFSLDTTSRTNSTETPATSELVHSSSPSVTSAMVIASQIPVNGTRLAVRLIEEPVIRLMELPSSGDVWDLFHGCAKTWPAKFLSPSDAQIHRILIRFEVIGGYLEIARPTAEADYLEFLKLVKLTWDKSDGGEVLYIPVLVLTKGEVARP